LEEEYLKSRPISIALHITKNGLRLAVQYAALQHKTERGRKCSGNLLVLKNKLE
jgi:hypothetical protein